MSSRVTKSLPSLVAPAEATPAGTLPLTAMDRALASIPMAALLVFEHPIDQPAETIRQALSRALVPYYPMAGRLTAAVTGDSDDDRSPRIACTGEGVAFVAASASCTMQEAKLCDARPAVTVDDLTIRYAGGGQHGSPDPPPLLLVQVTEFACGGFVLGVTWDHAVTDGAGMAQFLQAVGEFARGRGLPPSVSPPAPVRVDPALPELPPPVTAMTKAIAAGNHSDFPSSYITVPLSFINRIKAEFRRRRGTTTTGGGEVVPTVTCTAFDVFTAAIWRCRARATIAAGVQDGPTALIFTVNVRQPARAKAGYYGNVFAFGLAAASTVREVAGGEILDLVRMVRDAKARALDTFADGAAHIAGEMGGRLRGLDGYDTLYVTSWWNLGLDDVDFGGGGAERVVGDMERKVVPAVILCGRKDKAAEGGVAAMALCVKPEHAETFHAELRSLE